MATLTWVAAGAGNASTDANWSGGVKPVSGDTVIFDNTSDNNCSWDLDAATVTNITFSIAAGYDGTVTQAATADMGLASYTQGAGTFTADTGKTVTCAGNFAKTAGTLTSQKLNIIMSGNGTTFAENAGITLVSFRASANVTFGSSTSTRAVTVDESKTLTITTGKTLTHYYYDGAGYFLSDLGTIAGPGTYKVNLYDADKTITFGTLTAPTVVDASSAATANRKLTVAANAALGSTLTIQSSHASYTTTLDMAGKTLSATAITVSTRAVLTNSGAAAACSCSGAFTVSGASSVVSGAIALTYGTYVQSNGTATQVGNWSGGAVTASGGTLTGAGSASVTLTSSGDVNLTGATVTADKLNLVMTGAGKTVTVPSRLFALTVSNMVTLTTAGETLILSNLTVDAGAALFIPTGKTISVYASDATRNYSNSGTILGAGALAICLYELDKTYSLGTVLLPLTISALSGSAANRKLTVTGNPTIGSTLTVSSADAAKTMKLDFAGRSANIGGAVTVGTRGNILWGEGVHHLGGNLDTSAGAVNFETSQLIFTKAATLKTAAEQPLYDMLIAPDVTLTLGSDVTVSHEYGNGGVLVPGAFTLTASGTSYDKVFLPTVLKANISPLIYPTGKRFMRRLERVQ